MSLLTGTDLLYNIRKYFPLGKEEREALIIAVIAMALVVGFNDQRPTFELVPWLINLFVSALIVTLAVLVFISAQRTFALWWGYRTEIKVFYPGIGIALMLTLMTFGAYPWLWWLGMHGMQVNMIEAQRLGYFRHFIRIWDVAIISLMGPLSLLALALFFRILFFLPNIEVMIQAVRITTLYAFYQLIPVPPLAGHQIIFASRWLYFLVLGLTVGFALVLVNPAIPLIFSLLMAVILGVAFILLYFNFIEPKLM